LKAEVVKEIIGEDGIDQRIDNFLFKRYRNVPKSHIYQLLRSGQVRVNGKRIDFHCRLVPGDVVRIPPIMVPANAAIERRLIPKMPPFRIIFEDEALLVVDKPSGIAVHGGSGISFGVIEQLRAQHPEMRFLELAHRLDRETSGILLLAKKRSALVALHQQIRSGHTEKHYQVLVKGKWPNARQHVKLPLIKYLTKEGERRVTVATDKHYKAGEKISPFKAIDAHTVFTLLRTWPNYSLLNAELKTGRTHQIRVHLAHMGYPIIGDSKYGDFVINKQLSRGRDSINLDRMFLHAASMLINHPLSGQPLKLTANLPVDLQDFLSHLDA
jgi:23S rRNA pseudouridine955/2504/2580 synthase